MRESLTMNFGEKRKISVRVTSTCKKAFEVENATFLLKVGSDVEASGTCEVTEIRPDEMIISALVNPQRRGAMYTLEYHYDILPERLIYICELRTV